MPNRNSEAQDREIRSAVIEFRVGEDGDGDGMPTIEGYAAVFNARSENLGGRWWEYYEEIEPGAFRESIGEDDIVANFNHDSNMVLGRNMAETLSLSEDEKGLLATINPPDTTFARDLVTSIRRGDITGMSFAFQVLDSEWKERDGIDIRYLQKVRLFDVSVVTNPAYKDTSVGLRSLKERLEKIVETSQDRAERARKALEEYRKKEQEQAEATPPEGGRDVDGGDSPPNPAGGSTGDATPTEGERGANQEEEEARETEVDTGEEADWKVQLSHRRRKLELLELTS